MIEPQEEGEKGPSKSPGEKAETPKENGSRVGSWMELMGNDLRMKVVESSGSGENIACDIGDAVRVDFVGFRASNTDDEEWNKGEVFQDAKDWMVIIVDKDVCPALEMGIRFMKQGERAVIQSHSKYAYGPAGRKHGNFVLPPQSSVIFDVRITSVISADSKDFGSPAFQIERAVHKKKIGNDCYQNEWSDGYGKGRALQLYKRGADAMTKLLQDPLEEKYKKQAREIQLDCLNNTAAVLMRAKEYRQAKEAATQVLLQDRQNLKALLRAARAAMLDPASTYEESDAAVAAAEDEYPDSEDVRKMRGELKRRRHKYNKNSKAMFSKMAKSMRTETNKRSEDIIAKLNVGEKGSTETEQGPDPAVSDEESWERYAHKIIFYVIFLGGQFIVYFFLRWKYPKGTEGKPDQDAPTAVTDIEF